MVHKDYCFVPSFSYFNPVQIGCSPLLRGATGVKTTKIWILPGFCKIEHGSGGKLLMWLPKIYCGRLACTMEANN
jgi:hypothetical protein